MKPVHLVPSVWSSMFRLPSVWSVRRLFTISLFIQVFVRPQSGLSSVRLPSVWLVRSFFFAISMICQVSVHPQSGMSGVRLPSVPSVQCSFTLNLVFQMMICPQSHLSGIHLPSDLSVNVFVYPQSGLSGRVEVHSVAASLVAMVTRSDLIGTSDMHVFSFWI